MRGHDMKKTALGFLLMLGVSAVFSQEVIIREISGTVEVKAAGAADWSPARQGQRIARTTAVSTGFKSTAILEAGNSVLTVQPLTRLTVDEIQESLGKERLSFSLRTGRIRADVKPPAGGRTEFTVRSPTATASVRGTVFEFNGIQLRVDEGRVRLIGGDRSGVYVGAGRQVQTDIENGRTATAAETVREDLSPSPPPGMDSGAENKITLPPDGEVNAGFDWL
jgi:hypothetical protein